MVGFLSFLLITHGTLFSIDEYLFHKKRGLKKKEIYNSLIDGLFFLLPLTIAIFGDPKSGWRYVFFALSFLSCLSIMKNEIFYENLCIRERLLHAALYVLHPAILYSFYISWTQNYFDAYPNFWMFQLLYMIIGFQTLIRRLIYWNYIYEDKDK